MRDLKDLGIDLLELGRKEREAWDSDRIEWLLMQRGWSRDWDGRNWTLVGFQYGPSPEDWLVWIYDWNQSFTEFWDLVQGPSQSIPGAWPGE